MRGLALTVALCLAATSANAGDAELQQLLQALQPAPAMELASDEGEDGQDRLLAMLDDDHVVKLGGNDEQPRSRSVGRPQEGLLLGGRRLPDHPGYRIRNRDRAWATATTIEWLTEAFDAVVAADPSVPAIMIHDLSLQQGGPMNGHGSHQSGRDVDLMYYRHDCREGVCGARRVSREQLDAARQWALLSHLLKRDRVEFIFMDYALLEPLYEVARAHGASDQQLRTWFQWPRGPDHPSGRVRHWRLHRNHWHLRMRCPNRAPECVGTRVRRPRSSGGRSWGLLQLLDAEYEVDLVAPL